MNTEQQVNKLDFEITAIEKQITEQELSVAKLKEKKEQIFIRYHTILKEAGFYDNYIFYNIGKTLQKMFNISAWSNRLPYQYHGDGDYIRIKFKAESGKLILLYYCTYESGQYTRLISIPLDLFELEDKTQLQNFLEKHYIESEQTHLRLLREKQQKKIDQLTAELEKLKK